MTWLAVLNHLPALPEALLLVGACVLMLADARSADRRLGYWIAQSTLLACLVATLWVLDKSNGAKYYIFSDLFVADTLSHLLKATCYFAVSTALVYSRQYLLDRGLLRGEFISLLLFSLLGMMILISANSFLTVYLGLELMSLCLYALVALNRESAQATEAAMKYFVLGALSSGLLLYGMSMIYGATGTLAIPEVARMVGSLALKDHNFLVFGLVFLVAGVAFKIGVVPFHMWIPDVYHGAPTPVTLVIGSGPKIAAFAMAVRLLVNALPALAADWQQMLALLALLSIALGNITAIAQSNLKRMLAYSAIANMGFLLLGLLSGVVDGNARNAEAAYSASLFYIITYAIMTV
ncbi:MAG: NADH-quinone oxidoreductase subunit N, partial [Burkholderiales bacterium]